MKYLLVQTQEGVGCDYMIGCGMTYEFVEFDGSPKDAAEYFAKQIAFPEGEDEGCSQDGDGAIAEAWLVPASGAMQLDLDSLADAWRAKGAQEAEAEQQAREKKEFERLRKKFG